MFRNESIFKCIYSSVLVELGLVGDVFEELGRLVVKVASVHYSTVGLRGHNACAESLEAH